ncbi:MAG: hypothetical protein BRD55_03850 [Bacteroidetes bacterium SW_9_63_38]|nr:MAG: hypothetical protein BRD55_03850 [Bacteroidetes bacterium SW_9_63_38]
MRTSFLLLCFVLMLSLTVPAEAQFRETAQRSQSVRTQLYDSGSAGTNAFDALFGDNFRMGHSYEASFSSFGGQSASRGMYTNTMMWQFNSDWAARMDVSVSHPFTQGGNGAFGSQETQVFLRNAEVAYKPSDQFQVRFQVRQSPYGRYASPYGFAPNSHSGFRPTPTGDLFWKN